MTATELTLLVLAIIGTGVGVEVWRRLDEGRAVERANYREIVGLRAEAVWVAVEIARRHRAAEPFDETFFAQWRLSTPLIYPAVGAKLGLLSRRSVHAIGYFHAQLANARVRWAEARATGGFQPSPYRVLCHLLHAHGEVEPWVRRISLELPIELQGEPDRAEAYALIGELEQKGEERIVEAYWPF